MNVTRQQLQKKFKHAADFGITGAGTGSELAAFAEAVQKHVASGDTLHLDGWYRGQAAVLHVDPNTRLTVVVDGDGDFVSGWRLNPQQLECVLTTGRLGGS